MPICVYVHHCYLLRRSVCVILISFGCALETSILQLLTVFSTVTLTCRFSCWFPTLPTLLQCLRLMACRLKALSTFSKVPCTTDMFSTTLYPGFGGGHIIALIVLLHVYGDLLHQCLRMQILFWPHFTNHLKHLDDWEFAFGCEEEVGVILTTAELGLCERPQRIFKVAHILTIIDQIGYLFWRLLSYFANEGFMLEGQ